MSRLFAICLTLALLSPALVRADEKEQGFVPLFNGKDFTGWKKVGGGATYEIEGPDIVGKVGPGPNTFLRTEKTYGDFILKLDYRLDIPGNSGIQFRSHQQDGNGRVYGYQNEIDPSSRAWSSGIYDEARRGWLFPLTGHPEAQKAFKINEWNEVTIKAVGPHIQTWLNGVPAADLFDTMDMEGFIALQVHSGKEGQIRWRNVRLKDLGQSEWKPLFNGKDLEGWKPVGDGEWTIEDGAVHGVAHSEKTHGLLLSEKEYDDFALRVVYKANKGNSGVYFRSETVKDGVGVHGFQAEIDPEKDAGGLYETGGRGWVVQPKPEDVKKWYKPGEWNEMTIVAQGKRIVVHVNGIKTAELKNDEGRPKGHIALQLHGGQEMDVLFKSVEIMELGDEKK